MITEEKINNSFYLSMGKTVKIAFPCAKKGREGIFTAI